MSNKRSLTENFIITYIEKIAPGIGNKQIYQNFFTGLNDTQFDEFIELLASEKARLAIFVPNSKASVVSVENNLEIAKELKHEFFTRLFISGKENLPDHLTSVKHLVIDLPIRRASQLVNKKIKIPKNNKVIDSLSGQPTGTSKGAKISYPELLVLAAMGLDESIEELISVRGGDNKAFLAYSNFIDRYGKVSLKGLDMFRSVVKSTATLKTFMTAMHIKSTLVS